MPAAILARIPLPQDFEAEQRWQYSGEGDVLLQAILCAVTCRGFESSMTQRVFTPLGMSQTQLRMRDEAFRATTVPGHSWFGWRSQFDFREPNTAASLYTTASD